MKRFVSILLILCLLSAAVTACAATLISQNGSVPVSAVTSAVVMPDTWTCQMDEQWEDTLDLMPGLFDDDPGTDFRHICWYKYRVDDVPELQFDFMGETLAGLWIRNGRCFTENQYWSYARAAKMRLVITTRDGYTQELVYQMDDEFDPVTVDHDWHWGYQRMEFPQPIQNVSHVDLYIPEIALGSVEKYILYITDMKFMSTFSDAWSAYVSEDDYDDTVPGTGNDSFWGGSYPNSNHNNNGNNNGLYPEDIPTVPPYEIGDLIPGTINKRIATRTGPGTRYTEPGSFFNGGESIGVVSKVWDNENELWWLQVEFLAGPKPQRAYTVHQWINCDLDQVPEEHELGRMKLTKNTGVYYGPGTEYLKFSFTVYNGTNGVCWGYEDGYYLFEYYNSDVQQYIRVWVEESCCKFVY